jgi:Winged helix-turn-helix
MYNSFLSYYQVKEYLTILLDNGLLKYNSGTQKFRITEKVLSFLNYATRLTVLNKNNVRKFYNCRSDRRIALMVLMVPFSIQFED